MAQHDKQTPPNPADDPATPENGGSVESLALDAAVAESEDLRQKLIRWQADFQNLQRRSAKEILEARQWAEGDFAKSLITVLDHFDLALNVDPTKTDAATLLNGVKMTYDELKKVLSSRGVETYDPTNHPFDPHLHEAVMQEPSDKPAMTVLQTFQPGYRLGDRILRPAKVKVSAAK
jgi:molecular chaperone GrpE